ncbi:restriction endonuclease subunit S [Roseibacillus persicicus]|uniref:restriction endonuclease subunit S n=1 Tax=Roseibacillus persicicus TaxID=454148 RepID=UPI00280E046F|nr:restriction endonuclease subunit S [Roseibacillus persicicus]MDQ8192006.1 restriction endonuclease subunit S [Roseibacillus persicicus]
MKTAVKKCRLADIASFTNGGSWNQTEYSPTGVPVVRVSDVHGGTIDLSSCKYLTEEGAKKYSKNRLEIGDLIICTVGSHPTQLGSVVGRAGVVPSTASGALLNQNAVCIRPSDKSVDKCWLSYLGKSKEFHDYIKAHARGSASQVRMAIGLLKEMPIELPSLPTQRRIAGILSAYDDLIENNLRRIRILEEMAQSLYREWFVHFRIPPEVLTQAGLPPKLTLTNSPLGPIPEGWELMKLNELGTIGRGRSRHRPRNFTSLYGGPYPFFQTGDVKAAHNFLWDFTQTYSEMGLAQSKMWEEGTLCITIAANIAETAILSRRACFPDSIVGFVPDSNLTNVYFVMMSLKRIKEQMQNVSRGTTQDNLSMEKLLGFNIVLPKRCIDLKFEALITPFFEEQLSLLKRNQTLRQTRDLLLPKLLSPS